MQLKFEVNELWVLRNGEICQIVAVNEDSIYSQPINDVNPDAPVMSCNLNGLEISKKIESPWDIMTYYGDIKSHPELFL